MLKFARKMSDLSFGALMAVYEESCLEAGKALAPRERDQRQIAIGEEDFYNYLTQIFFRTPDAVCVIWEEKGKYCSALRLEPYKDGLLLAALETAPDQRGRGYATMLLNGVLKELKDTKIYSHISRKNVASRKVHEACGFRKCMDYAVYVDGSVSHDAMTYCYL